MPGCASASTRRLSRARDANSSTTDACVNCRTAVCGDGFVHAGTEQCDDANGSTTDACINCQNAYCGDGFVRAGVEQCDDANAVDTDACNHCHTARCGDGAIQTGVEECEPGVAPWTGTYSERRSSHHATPSTPATTSDVKGPE